ncbi:MAG TPA: acylphosphatase [Burkholderiales bacterium]
MVTRQIRVRGRVQGVGFRYALRREAERAGVRGWVRNRRDGSVEALMQGDAQAVAALIAWARRGPPAARVDELHESVADPALAQDCEAFEERPTV